MLAILLALASQSSAAAEVQINLCAQDPAMVAHALGLKAAPAGPTKVWLFDTRDFALHEAGLRLRLRVNGKSADLTLKVAGQDCERLDLTAYDEANTKCEYDLHGDSFDGALSLSRELDAGQVQYLVSRPAAGGARVVEALKNVLSPDQARFLLGRQLPDALERLGPSTVRAFRKKGERYAVEAWTLPDQSSFVEVSEKTSREAAIALRSALDARLTAAGVTICADQRSQAAIKLKHLTQSARS